jgi:hypothetical protein
MSAPSRITGITHVLRAAPRGPYASFANGTWKTGKRGADYWLPAGKEDNDKNRLYGDAAEAAAKAAGNPRKKAGKASKRVEARRTQKAFKNRPQGQGPTAGERIATAGARGGEIVAAGGGFVGSMLSLNKLYSIVAPQSYMKRLERRYDRAEARADAAREELQRGYTPELHAKAKKLAREFRAVRRAYEAAERVGYPLMGTDRVAALAASGQESKDKIAAASRWDRENRKRYGSAAAVAMNVARRVLTVPFAVARVAAGIPGLGDLIPDMGLEWDTGTPAQKAVRWVAERLAGRGGRKHFRYRRKIRPGGIPDRPPELWPMSEMAARVYLAHRRDAARRNLPARTFAECRQALAVSLL